MTASRHPAVLVMTCALAIIGVSTWLQWRSWRSTRQRCQVAVSTLHAMQVDAEEILRLQDAPKRAAGQARSNEDLLAQIEEAVEAAGIDRQQWRDSIPQPPMRIPATDYQVQATRLFFDAMTLRQLATLAHHLLGGDPTLRLTTLDLSNRESHSPHYDVDVTLSYWVYAPRAD